MPTPQSGSFAGQVGLLVGVDAVVVAVGVVVVVAVVGAVLDGELVGGADVDAEELPGDDGEHPLSAPIRVSIAIPAVATPVCVRMKAPSSARSR
jgi:hypothetical protein